MAAWMNGISNMVLVSDGMSSSGSSRKPGSYTALSEPFGQKRRDSTFENTNRRPSQEAAAVQIRIERSGVAAQERPPKVPMPTVRRVSATSNVSYGQYVESREYRHVPGHTPVRRSSHALDVLEAEAQVVTRTSTVEEERQKIDQQRHERAEELRRERAEELRREAAMREKMQEARRRDSEVRRGSMHSGDGQPSLETGSKQLDMAGGRRGPQPDPLGIVVRGQSSATATGTIDGSLSPRSLDQNRKISTSSSFRSGHSTEVGTPHASSPAGEVPSKVKPGEPGGTKCPLYRARVWLLDSTCECGRPKRHPIHTKSVKCLHCGETFCALENKKPTCRKHTKKPVMVSVEKDGQKIFAWGCCPDQNARCKNMAEFMQLKLPHGHHCC
mmetsp:Transcript_25863/g.40490  ORF Transcript_25863/g.40490 Transcript_25863/m.40490 type:complete len:386 (+) Transcript_25863:44-1201(+)|eukprot:CAMPEP_0184310892 /NCGR_PEP_ID=MMETSP1049-20130417/35815_1 /TAXON_ID=77928 /ORGANISM="Proteomonas sulcata, Strain CCMP704" /LENGTH=385 /DNA_ID=CAMNT_0026625671 /DNA_START=46 /DNA_END=1203 /DNA_ORIENTATION=-